MRGRSSFIADILDKGPRGSPGPEPATCSPARVPAPRTGMVYPHERKPPPPATTTIEISAHSPFTGGDGSGSIAVHASNAMAEPETRRVRGEPRRRGLRMEEGVR